MAEGWLRIQGICTQRGFSFKWRLSWGAMGLCTALVSRCAWHSSCSPAFHLLAAASSTCFHASADTERWQQDPLLGRALAALSGEGEWNKSWDTPQILWYPAKTWTRQRASMQQDGAGSAGLSGPARQVGLVQTRQLKSSLPLLSFFLQHCSMHTLAGCCPGTLEILPSCCWLLSLPRQSLVVLEKPFPSSSLWKWDSPKSLHAVSWLQKYCLSGWSPPEGTQEKNVWQGFLSSSQIWFDLPCALVQNPQ